MAYEIRTFPYNSTDYKKSLDLRNRILRIPLGLQFTREELERDQFDTHMGLFENDQILACLILVRTGNRKMKMRQVATEEGYQGKGFGRKLSAAAEKYALAEGFDTTFCHARKTAAPFYTKLGYEIIGDEFTEVNILHYVMEKKLQ